MHEIRALLPGVGGLHFSFIQDPGGSTDPRTEAAAVPSGAFVNLGQG